MDVGSAKPLLDLRLVRNLVGESSLGFFASSSGSSLVAPPSTPMLSLAVFTTAGALDRQLPEPLSHVFPFGVRVPAVEGVVAPFEDAVDSARDVFDGAFGRISLALGVFAAVVVAAVSAAGAWEFGFDFLRGLIRADCGSALGRQEGLFDGCQHVSRMCRLVTTSSLEADGVFICSLAMTQPRAPCCEPDLARLPCAIRHSATARPGKVLKSITKNLPANFLPARHDCRPQRWRSRRRCARERIT
jgi:hypothetical protein